MKTAKRVLVVLAVVALLVGALGLTTFAADSSVNSDDFNTVNANTGYATRTTTNKWVGTNCAVMQGGTSDSSPTFKFIGSSSSVKAFCMNGKTTAKGSIVSPTLTGGIEELTLNYGLPFGDTKIKFTITITDSNGATQSETVQNLSATKLTAYSHTWTLTTPVAGDFTIKIVNDSPSNSTSNKDRTAIWNINWTSCSTVVEKTDSEKLEYEAEKVEIESDIWFEDTTVTLPSAGGYYQDVAIEWTCDSEFVSIENNVAEFTVPELGADDEVVTLTAKFTIGENTYYEEYTVTLHAPMTEAEVVDAAFALASGATLPGGTYTLTGVVSSIKSAYSSQYHNADINMTVYDSNGAKKTILCFRLSGSGADAVKVGDEITVTGNIKNYNGTIEFDAGCTLDKYPAPVAIEGASLNIKDNIDVYYYVAVNAGFTSASASFTFDGKTTTVSSYKKLEDGRLMFVFEGINPAQLGDAINATVSVKYVDNTYTASHSGMSVKKYYQMAQNYEGTKNDTALMTLLSDLLVYGAAAQAYVGDTDALVTEGLELTPSTNAIPESVFASTGDAFKSVALELGSDVTFVIGVALEGGDVVTVNFNGITTTYAQEDLVADENGVYTIKVAGVFATAYAEVLTAEVNGNTLTYSVNSYINEKANDENANLAALVAALNNYGASAAAYKNA